MYYTRALRYYYGAAQSPDAAAPYRLLEVRPRALLSRRCLVGQGLVNDDADGGRIL